MARKTYRHSDETYQAIVGHESEIAREMGCCPTYIYGLKNRDNPDPFPKFEELYRSTAFGGGCTKYWFNVLKAIDDRAENFNGKCADKPDALACLLEKIHREAETTARMVDALKDGQLDKRECHLILGDIETLRANLNLIETIAVSRLGVIGEVARQ